MPRGVYDRKKKDDEVVVERVDAVAPESLPLNTDTAAMNDLARRIWDGQGSIPLVERVERIVNALKDKGYDITGLELPDPEFRKYIK